MSSSEPCPEADARAAFPGARWGKSQGTPQVLPSLVNSHGSLRLLGCNLLWGYSALTRPPSKEVPWCCCRRNQQQEKLLKSHFQGLRCCSPLPAGAILVAKLFGGPDGARHGEGRSESCSSAGEAKGCSSSFTLGIVSDGPEYSETILPAQRLDGPTSRAPVVLSILALAAQTFRGVPDLAEM